LRLLPYSTAVSYTLGLAATRTHVHTDMPYQYTSDESSEQTVGSPKPPRSPKGRNP